MNAGLHNTGLWKQNIQGNFPVCWTTVGCHLAFFLVWFSELRCHLTSLLIFLTQLEVEMVSCDSFSLSQVFLSLFVRTSFGQYGDGVNPSFNFQLNELHSKETLSYFQAWFILAHHSEATIQSGFLFPGESGL